MKRKPPLLDPPYAKRRDVTPQEEQLWNAEAGQKKDTGRRRILPPRKAAATPPKPLPPSSPATPLPTDSLPTPAFDGTLRAKIRKGAVPIDATLDLHGHTRISAQGVLERFIAVAQARGLRTLLIITGKGRGGQAGVLGEWLERTVTQPPLRAAVIGCEQASLRHGGGGAWYLRIRKIADASL